VPFLLRLGLDDHDPIAENVNGYAYVSINLE
jgi:hypothetical protein